MSRHDVGLIFLLLAVSLLCTTLQSLNLTALAEWRADYIEQGQWMRILSGNFAHTNFAHLTMNLAVLWVIAFVFRPSVRSYAALLVIISIGVGIGILYTPIKSYVGLSGTLHGLFAYYALREALQGRMSSWILVAGVVTKIIWELTVGSPISTAEIINARVAVEAHFLGVINGILFALVSYPLYKNDR
ncbi:rhombosortase [Vibrio sp. 404]|uniref:Rhombosortase n=1 Tax=Vibrio marinisediminis TaxID=2758441 RepID=A0A7W2ISW0_9VIBR|nr:rhombosortase [Vibrio marinisediminis]